MAKTIQKVTENGLPQYYINITLIGQNDRV